LQIKNYYCNIAIYKLLKKRMGATKTEFYTDEQNKLAILAKAIGHPARVAIIDYLLKVNACICDDIVNELPLAQPTISQHLRELKNAGIIKGSIEKNAICYCIDEKSLEVLQEYLGSITSKIKDKNSKFC
jgi:DNA-binding transcriptional ArsR family regulator